jgi:hypothetical protein
VARGKFVTNDGLAIYPELQVKPPAGKVRGVVEEQPDLVDHGGL